MSRVLIVGIFFSFFSFFFFLSLFLSSSSYYYYSFCNTWRGLGGQGQGEGKGKEGEGVCTLWAETVLHSSTGAEKPSQSRSLWRKGAGIKVGGSGGGQSCGQPKEGRRGWVPILGRVSLDLFSQESSDIVSKLLVCAYICL